MSIHIGDFKMTSERYQSGAAVQEYNGTYYLCAAKQNDKGIWSDWCYPQVFERSSQQKGPGQKAMPMRVVIGNSKKEAIETLKHFLWRLENREEKPAEQPPMGDIPF